MENKICARCQIIKEINNFEFRQDTKKYRNYCRKCIVELCAIHKKSPKIVKDNIGEGFNKCIKCGDIKQHSEFNIRKDTRKHRNYCKNCEKEFFRKHDKKRRPQIAIANKARYKKDINFRLCHLLRSRLTKILRRGKISVSAVRDLGCTIDELKKFLEIKFYNNIETGEEMSWNNYGKWHIDHIFPLSKGNLADLKECRKMVHYTNLQPLWSKDNLKKGNKIIQGEQYHV
jgi:hypothetical protein